MDADDGTDRPESVPPAPEVTLVAAGELREAQRWQPTALHPGPAFKTVEWSADGTTVIASTASKSILSYVLPADLLASRNEDDRKDNDDDDDNDSSPYHDTITPQGRLRFGIAPASLAPAPYFSLAEPWSQSVLVGFRDRPIQLYPLFPGEGDDDDDDDGKHKDSIGSPSSYSTPLASYPLIKPETEAYLPPMALLWPAPGTHFVVGTKSLLALFDISRTSNDPPLLRVPTVTYTGGGFALGIRGTVSALAAGTGASHSLTAAGTWTRGIGLYDLTRAGGECAAHWKVGDTGGIGDMGDIGGDGIVQTLWSPCGRYLVINERKSRGLLVYDVRGSGKLLCTLAGRPAHATQPIRCTVYQGGGGGGGGGTVLAGDGPSPKGFELWSGTDSGAMVLYEGVGTREGVVEPSWRWQAHKAMVGGTAMHPSGSVMATCAASPAITDGSDSDSESESESDNDGDSESGASSAHGGSENDSEDEDEGEDEDDDSDGAPSSSSGHASRRTRKPQRTISDPSIKIWSLVTLTA